VALRTIGAVVTLNIVGFPEVELAEGGAAALGGGAWLFEAAVAEFCIWRWSGHFWDFR